MHLVVLVVLHVLLLLSSKNGLIISIPSFPTSFKQDRWRNDRTSVVITRFCGLSFLLVVIRWFWISSSFFDPSRGLGFLTISTKWLKWTSFFNVLSSRLWRPLPSPQIYTSRFPPSWKWFPGRSESLNQSASAALINNISPAFSYDGSRELIYGLEAWTCSNPHLFNLSSSIILSNGSTRIFHSDFLYYIAICSFISHGEWSMV